MATLKQFYKKLNPQRLEFIIFIILIVLIFILPDRPLDPWGLFRIKKITQLIVAVVVIQLLAQELTRRLGSRQGALTTGLLAGLISSTALTISLANRSHSSQAHPANLALQLAGGILAMLIEAVVLIFIGIQDWQFRILLPMIPTILLVMFWIKIFWQPSPHAEVLKNAKSLDLFSAFKLSGFIFFVIVLTKSIENWGGRLGIYFLTFIVSLFEVHGSIIANVQLYEAQSLDFFSLCTLLCLSIIASLLAKMAVVQVLGAKDFSRLTWKMGLSLAAACLLGWFFLIWIK